jgi:DNA repair ATPase RecN
MKGEGMEFDTRWPIVRGKKFNVLARKYNRLTLEMGVVTAENISERYDAIRSRNELIEANHTIEDLRTQLVEANGELMDIRMRAAL